MTETSRREIETNFNTPGAGYRRCDHTITLASVFNTLEEQKELMIRLAYTQALADFRRKFNGLIAHLRQGGQPLHNRVHSVMHHPSFCHSNPFHGRFE